VAGDHHAVDPGENDSDAELDALSRWIAAELGVDVPLHFTAFHPDWKMREHQPTPPATLTRARAIATGAWAALRLYRQRARSGRRQHVLPWLRNVLIGRDWYELNAWGLDAAGCCRRCGTALAGVLEPRPGSWGRRRQPVRFQP
jgi:pyruvate formate lyase activating enzyme